MARTPAPTAVERDDKDNLRAMARTGSQLPSQAGASTAARPYNFGCEAYYPVDLPPPTQVSSVPAANSGQVPTVAAAVVVAETQHSPPKLGTKEQTIMPMVRSAASKAGKGAKSSAAKVSAPDGTPRRPTPRFGKNRGQVPSLSSVPELCATRKRPPQILHGAAKASTTQAAASKVVASMAHAAANSTTTAKCAAATGSKPPSCPISAVMEERTGSAATNDASPSVNVVALATGRRPKRAANSVAPSQPPAAAGGKDNLDGVAALLALTGRADNTSGMARRTQEHSSMQAHTLASLAKTVGRMQVEQQRAAHMVVVPAAAVATPAQDAPQLYQRSESPTKRFKATDARAAIEGGTALSSTGDTTLDVTLPAQSAPVLTTTQRATIAQAASVSKKRVQGMLWMCSVRDDVTPKVKAMMGNAMKTIEVFISPNERDNFVLSCTMTTLKMGESDAEGFLGEQVNLPTRQRFAELKPHGGSAAVDDAKIQTTRVRAALIQAIRAVMGNFKRNVVSVWFSTATGARAKDMRPDVAAEWLVEDKFCKKPLGRKGVIAGVARAFRYCGSSCSRVRMPMNRGDEMVVSMTKGHFGAGAEFVYEALLSIKDGKADKHGIDEGRYKNYVQRVVSLDSFLRKLDGDENGIKLVDVEDDTTEIFENEFLPGPPAAVAAVVEARAAAEAPGADVAADTSISELVAADEVADKGGAAEGEPVAAEPVSLEEARAQAQQLLAAAQAQAAALLEAALNQ